VVDEIWKDGNLLDKLLSGFPIWERLHGFWRTLPSFNPHAVSSEPGQDLEGEALAVLFGDQEKGIESGVDDADDCDGLWETDPLNAMQFDGEEELGVEKYPTPDDTEIEPTQPRAGTPVSHKPPPFNHFCAPSISSSVSQSSKSVPGTARRISNKSAGACQGLVQSQDCKYRCKAAEDGAEG